MNKVKIYLKTALFALPEAGDNLPAGCMIMEGEVEDKLSGGLIIKATSYYNIRHKELSGSECRLFVPMSKIDHIRLLD